MTVRGDAERLPHEKFLRVKITGMDPQLHLPSLAPEAPGQRLKLELKLRVSARPA